jgi:ferritin
MEMSETLQTAFNHQITMELESSVVYLQMAAHLEARSLTGMAGWMRVQSDEERTHAIRFFDHVLHRGNDVAISSIAAPEGVDGGPAEVFGAALEQERKVTASITQLYRLAMSEGEVASLPMLQWFLEEQVEEEATVSEILGRLELAGSDGSALLQLDRELGQRSTIPPAEA